MEKTKFAHIRVSEYFIILANISTVKLRQGAVKFGLSPK